MNLLKKINFSWILFLFSLLFFACIFYLVRHFMVNLDELDNILAPFLMFQGKTFYRDIFNMHFPLPFYIAYFFTPFWVNQDPSRAIAVFRLSLLSVYFLSFLFTFISFKNPKTKNTFSLWIILLSLLVPLYHGNLYLSETFTAIFISSIFWLSIPIFLKWENFSNYHLYLLIFFASLAFWTQPMMILLFLIPFLFIKKNQWIKFLLTSLCLNLIPLLFFLINHQFKDFWIQTITFNSQIYSHFFPEQINNYNMFQQNIIYFFKNEISLLSSFTNSTTIFQLISHLSLLVLVFTIFSSKNYRYIAIFLAILLSISLREIKITPGSIFNFAIFPMLSISSAATIILFFLFQNKKLKVILLVNILIIFSCNILDFSPIFKQSLNKNYNYDVFWSYRQRIGETIAKLTQPEEKILIYPHDSDLYYFAKRQPVDRFPYWYPWIDSSTNFKQERLQSLKDNPPSLIYIGDLGFKDQKDYYSKLFPNLTQGYSEVFKDNQTTHIWIKSDLISRLQPLNFSPHASTSE